MYDRAFAPLTLRGATIPNRVFRPAHYTGLARGTPVSDELIAYHLERAKGGVGLTILEAAAVHPSSILGLTNLDDGAVANYQKFMRAIASTDMKVFQQLWHGGYQYPAPDGGPSWAPSATPARFQTFPPRAMTTAQVGEVVAAFAAAARRCEQGGLHGVEVHCGHGYLLAQFLSPVINQRADQYGGSPENRRRIIVEIAQAIRAVTSPGFVVGIRVSDSGDPKVLPVAELNAACRALDAMKAADGSKLLDFLNVSHGDYYDNVLVTSGMDMPAGYQMDTSREIGTGVTAPRFVVGRYGTLDDVEQALRAGDADMVGMVRALIADAEIVNKSRAGQAQDVRPCLGCNQGCLGGAITTGSIGCVVNVGAGREAQLGEHLITRAATSKHVYVIGGGASGMEAARVAALRGHRVTLAEAAPDLGGALKYAKQLPKLKAIADIAIWLEAEIYRLGVDVKLSTYVDADDVAQSKPDVVIVATGSDLSDESLFQPARPADLARVEAGTKVLNAVTLLDARAQDLGRAAIVLDDVGHYEAVACCEELLSRGLDVTYVTRELHLAPQVEATARLQSAKKRLYALGKFRIVPESVLVSAGGGKAEIKNLYATETTTIDCDTIVHVGVRQPLDTLSSELASRVAQVIVVGDAKTPRELQAAIREGHLAARGIT